MKAIAFLNIKGGVAKTTSTLVFASILHDEYHKRVLVLDCDKQSNSTKALECYGAEYTTADLLIEQEPIAELAVQHSPFGIDVIGASWKLLKANEDVLLDKSREQQYRLKRQLERIADNYDYILVDCPPDINIVTINVLAFVDEVLIPIRVDRWAFDGLEYVLDAVEEMREFNPKLKICGGFVTHYQTNTNLSVSGTELLKNDLGLAALDTYIRMTVNVGESTFFEPLVTYAPNCTATEDYRKLVAEVLRKGC